MSERNKSNKGNKSGSDSSDKKPQGGTQIRKDKADSDDGRGPTKERK